METKTRWCSCMVRRVLEAMVLFIFLAFAASCCRESLESRVAKEPPSQTITASELLYNYIHDPAQFDLLFTEKIIAVSGYVLGISDNGGSYSVIMEQSSIWKMGIEFIFRDNHSTQAQIAQIDLGTHLTIKGYCVGRQQIGNVEIRGCQVIE
jgi:hypothetical protein